jgi:fumarylacetoacetate (FAA) hydrolase
MKLVTYLNEGQERAGILERSSILDLETSLAWLEHQAGRPSGARELEARYGSGVLGFIEHAGEARPAADTLVRMHLEGSLPATHGGRSLSLPASTAKLASPLPRPPSMRDGYAFRQHVETARRNRGLEMIPEFDLFPIFYFTNHQAVVGPGDVHVQKLHLDKLDFELEAAVIVGKKARNLSAATADDAIFGMTVMNDFSARALQMEEMKMSLGPAKGKDFATSLGPCLVTIDELQAHAKETAHGRAYDLGMRAHVNGVQVSQGNVKDMSWTFAQILERASYGVTLYPGDVIGSGTCGTGCFLELNGSKVTSNQWLQPNDVVVLDIDGLGKLENRIVLDA